MGSKTSKNALAAQLSPEEIAILKVNSNLSEEEIQKIYSEFRSECPSGKMSKRQYRKLCEQFLHQDINQDIMDSLFETFDGNKSGTIEFDEFLATRAIRGSNDIDTKLDIVFNLLDKSHDGYLTYDELRMFWEKALKKNGDEDAKLASGLISTSIFEKLGLSNYQKASKQQFIDGCKHNRELLAAFL